MIAISIVGCCNNGMDRGIRNSKLIFPNTISPVYYLDTMQVPSPVVVYMRDTVYVVPETALREFNTIDSFILRKDVIYLRNDDGMRYIDYLNVYNYSSNPRLLYHYCDYLPDNLIFRDSMNGIEIYDFYVKPYTFILTLETRYAIPIMAFYNNEYSDDEIEGYNYSKDYVLTLLPVYTEQDYDKIVAHSDSRLDSVKYEN